MVVEDHRGGLGGHLGDKICRVEGRRKGAEPGSWAQQSQLRRDFGKKRENEFSLDCWVRRV